MAATDPIDIQSDQLRIRILPQGAALVGVRISDTRNLVLGFANPADHTTIPIFAGSVVGPVANRVRAGLVEMDGKQWQMPMNEAGRTSLHSGPDGLHAQLWRVTAYAPDTVTLTCTLTHGACGLPGNRRFIAQYTVEGPTLTLTIEAQTDEATPINVAAHPYWNLDGTNDVSNHQLQVFAHQYLPTDAHNLPTGALGDVAQTPFDFTSSAAVPLMPDLDVNYCLAATMRASPEPAALLKGGDGTTLAIATTAPGLQVYNGAHLPQNAPQTADFPPLAPYAAIALEPQHWPDAPHHSHFPDITLLPNRTYRQITRYTLGRG